MMETKLKYLNVVPRSNGTTDIYVRRYRKNCKAHRMEALPGTTDFLIEYAEAIAKQERLTDKPQGVGSYDSLEWLFKQYLASPEFKQVTPDTQTRKKARAEQICAVKLRGESLSFGEQDYTLIGRSQMYKFRAHVFEMGATEENPGFPGRARNWVMDVSAVFRWACKAGVAPDHFTNPCDGMGQLKTGPGFHTWTEKECQQFEDFWPIGTMQRLAYELAVGTGGRVSDLYRLGKVHEKDGMLSWKPFKGQDVGGEVDDDNALEVAIPIRPQLRTALDATPSGNLVYLATSWGTPFKSAKAFSQWLVKARKQAKLPDECVPHGLRKVAATNLAEAGASEFMLMSVMGWTNPSQAKVYTEKARRKSMAKKAMDMLDDEEQK